MNVPTPSFQDVPASDRAKLKKLVWERDVLAFAFSYKALRRLLERFGVEDDEEAAELLKGCVAATDSDGCEKVTKELNDQIGEIFIAQGLKSLRDYDPFGRHIDICLKPGNTGNRLNQGLLVENAPEFGISTKKILQLIKASRKPGREYTTVSISEVKEKLETQLGGR